jgi:hypothetical protein
MNYRSIKELAAQLGKPIPHLLALARKNDPFYCGCESQKRDADWFLTIWERFSFDSGVHLRRIHYRVISDKQPVLLPDGMPYTNSLECWNYLGDASKAARYLGLVDPAAFVDRRNPDPLIFAGSRDEPVPESFITATPEWSLPGIEIRLEAQLDMPGPVVIGYDYELADQRYHLGLWIEKSTMHDVLEPLCRRFGMDLIPGVGFQSITSVVTMLRARAAVHRKPVRIFYIADFDPAGERMPVAVARQIEFWIGKYAPDIEIKLTALVLTREQVIYYRLPRIPIKESDLRRKGFEDRHGEGAVELDALEAMYPGELARIVSEAVEPYFDEHLWKRLANAGGQTADRADAEWQALVEEQAGQLEEVRAEAHAVAEKFQRRATKLQEDFNAAMEPIEDRLKDIRHAVQEKAGQFHVDLPDRPEPARADVDESGWLFDSNRGYMEQMSCYRAYKGISDGD